MKKKIVALLTVVTLMVTMLSITTFAEEYAISFTYTPVTRENIDTIIEEGNDVSSDGVIKGWSFFKKGELQYYYDGAGWIGSSYRDISKPKNFDDIDQVLETIEFINDAGYNDRTFTGVTANDVKLELTTIPSFPNRAVSGYSFINPTAGETDEIDAYLLFNLEPIDNQIQGLNNPNTADTNSALPYGCATVASLVLIVLSLRKIKLEKVNRNK